MSSGSLWFLYTGAVYRGETGGRHSREVAQTTAKAISEAERAMRMGEVDRAKGMGEVDRAKGMGEVDRATCKLDVMLKEAVFPMR